MRRIHFFLLAGVLLCQILVYYRFSTQEVIPSFRPWSEFPRQVGNWKLAQEIPEDEASLALLQPDDYIDRSYTAPNSPEVNLFVAYFKTQRTGHGPHSPEACLPGSGWEPVSVSNLPISVPASGITIDANQYVVRRAGIDMAVYYWYQTSRKTVASQYMYQIYAIPELLTHGRTDVALVRVITPVQAGNMDAAREVAIGFIRQLFPVVRSFIPQA